MAGLTGRTIAFAAPSGRVEKGSLDRAVSWFESLGMKVEIMPHVYDSCRYMAGSDRDRAADICRCFAREDIGAVFCVRGGAGSSKILDLLDYDLIARNPKPVFGLSDSTALQNALFACTGNISYTGFLPAYDFKEGQLPPMLAQALLKVLKGERFTAAGGKTLNPGTASGIMVGGCLSVFCYLCGTRYFPDLSEKIILLEDVGEKTYKLELMLNQLRRQPGFSRAAGMVFGRFAGCLPVHSDDGTVADILKDFAAGLDIPIMYDFPYGHCAERFVLPIGGRVNLDTVAGMLKIC